MYIHHKQLEKGYEVYCCELLLEVNLTYRLTCYIKDAADPSPEG